MKDRAPAPPHDLLELVYRWKVRQDCLDEFFERLNRIVTRFVRDRGEPDVGKARISQPVLGPAGDVWELRLELRDLSHADRLLEAPKNGDGELLWQLAAVGRPPDAGGLPVAEVLESSAPLCRTWIFPRRPAE